MEWQHLNTRLFCAEYFVKRWMVPITTRTMPDLDQAGPEYIIKSIYSAGTMYRSRPDRIRDYTVKGIYIYI